MGARTDDPGLIYYLLDATRLTQRVKIGYTSNLNDRLRALAYQTISRQVPVVLALEEGDITLERQRHEEFRDHRIIGEWFRYEDDLTDHIRSLPNPIGWIADRPDLWVFAAGWQSFTGWKRPYNKPPAYEDTEFEHERAPVVF